MINNETVDSGINGILNVGGSYSGGLPLGPSVQDLLPNRIADLNPDDIADIELSQGCLGIGHLRLEGLFRCRDHHDEARNGRQTPVGYIGQGRAFQRCQYNASANLPDPSDVRKLGVNAAQATPYFS